MIINENIYTKLSEFRYRSLEKHHNGIAEKYMEIKTGLFVTRWKTPLIYFQNNQLFYYKELFLI